MTSNVNAISRISAGTVIKGEILSPSDIRIDGTFEGKVQSKGRVVVGETAVIKGDIICENVDLWGKVEGNLFVKDTLALKSGCRVDGNLSISRLSVELGAVFNGTCKTGAPAPEAAPKQNPQKLQEEVERLKSFFL